MAHDQAGLGGLLSGEVALDALDAAGELAQLVGKLHARLPCVAVSSALKQSVIIPPA